MLPPLLPESFFARDALDVARDLLGQVVHYDGVALRIVETEAYRGPWDTACHAAKGRTPRNQTLHGPPGRTYVYVCYGIHQMLNLVSGEDGVGTGVLVRAAEPVLGLPTIRARRGGRSGPVLLSGPGKVGQALGIDTSFNGHRVFVPGGITVHQGTPPTRIVSGPRVGVDYASPEHRDAPWRLADGESKWVSQRRRLS